MNRMQEAALRVDAKEDRERRNIALASAVSRKWGHEHDIGCPGDHQLELSWNRLVKYPCPR